MNPTWLRTGLRFLLLGMIALPTIEATGEPEWPWSDGPVAVFHFRVTSPRTSQRQLEPRQCASGPGG